MFGNVIEQIFDLKLSNNVYKFYYLLFDVKKNILPAMSAKIYELAPSTLSIMLRKLARISEF
jgi:hypothetical protein